MPTIREAGGTLANFNAKSWNGLAVPARTPPEVIARLNSVVNAALHQAEVRNKLADLTLNAQGSTPEQLGQVLAADIQRGLVRGRINAQRQATGDHETGPRQAAGKRGSGVHARA